MADKNSTRRPATGPDEIRSIEVHPAPAAVDLLSFIDQVATAAYAIPTPLLVANLQRWAGRQGFDVDVRIALGDLVRAVLNHDQDQLGKAVRGVADPAPGFIGHEKEEHPDFGPRARAQRAASGFTGVLPPATRGPYADLPPLGTTKNEA